MKLFKRLFALATIISTLALIPACETMEGAGRDIQHAGRSIERAAD